VSDGAASVIRTPCSLDREVGLGAQAHERRLREAAEEAGGTRFRRATETPFNLVLEARR
jgi:hypothetical protein